MKPAKWGGASGPAFRGREAGAEARPTDLFSLERALDRGDIVAAV
jgi:hypothetical protein